MNRIARHFDRILDNNEYEFFKKKNWYYYQNLKELYQSLVPRGARVLDVGCGTGDILASLQPGYGLGIDISKRMIQRARHKWRRDPKIRFYQTSPDRLKLQTKFDYIILADVIEHLTNVNFTINSLCRFCSKRTQIIISMANPLWEPILLISEMLHLKAREGPHKRISIRNLEDILIQYGFCIQDKGFRFLIPIYIPWFSRVVNDNFYKVLYLRRLGENFFLVARLKD